MEKPHLTVVSGPRQGMQVLLDVSPFTLGRKTDNTLALPDPTVSSHHARIVEHIGLYWLEDLGSTNGTYLSPPRGEEFRLEPGRPVLLVEGARIRLGDRTALQVEGIVASQDEDTRRALQCLQDVVAARYEDLMSLEPAQRQEILDDLRRFEGEIRRLNSEAELVRLITEMVADLTRTVVCTGLLVGTDLPPVPEEIIDRDPSTRLPSLHNLFLSGLHISPEPPGEEEEKVSQKKKEKKPR